MKLWMACSFTALAAFGWAGPAAAPASVPAPPQPLSVTLHVRQSRRRISRYEYGMFIENLGSLVYRSLWAQMLDDRKFYFPITPARPHPGQSKVPAFFRRLQPRKWRPVGPPAAITLDPRRPFVGAHSPRIALAATAARGIRQSGFSLVAGQRYRGHIWLRGSRGARVRVRLSWGTRANQSRTITLPPLSPAYRKFPLRFTAGGTTGAGALAITGQGTGSFHIGVVSLMPADNLEGFRPEVIAQLRRLHSGFWRFPGGNFVADFNWYDAIGPRDRRPPVLDHAWNAVQPNDVGLDEFMTLCRLIGAAPYITVNAGFGDAHSAGEEVEYMNGSAHTRLGALRGRDGHPAPYHVQFWNIGNEPYGTWELGRTDLKYYVLKHNEFARAMRRADPAITLLASGAMPDEETIEGIAAALHLKNDQVPFCSPADWTCAFLQHCWGNFDGITEHWYARAGVRFDLRRAIQGVRVHGMEAGYVPARESLLQWVRQPSNRVRLKAEEWREYERRYPQMAQKKIFMSIDEYAYTGAPANLKLALAYAMVFNEMLRHTDFLRMSAFTMGVSTLDLSPTAAALNTTGLLFKLYQEHLGPGLRPIALSGNSPQPPPRQQFIDGVLPRTNAGSPTYPLDMLAAVDRRRQYLTLAVVNATRAAQPFTLHVRGARLAGGATLWTMTGPHLKAANRLGHAPQVTVSRRRLALSGATLSAAPLSISIYRFALRP